MGYYPDATFPNPSPNQNRNPVQGGSPPGPGDYNQLFLKRQGVAGGATSTAPESCDGHDELGCYQVRLYYDWFLIPGSCKWHCHNGIQQACLFIFQRLESFKRSE